MNIALFSALPRGEDLCRACAEEGPTCCRSLPEHAAQSFPLSTPEWERLAEHLHLAAPCPIPAGELKGPNNSSRPLPDRDMAPGDAIRAAEFNSEEFIQSIEGIFPGEKNVVNALFPQGGTHWRLRTTPKGACVFLNKDGCRLPRSHRPWYCRIYPAWINKGALTLFVGETCLIAKHVATPQDGLTLLGMPLADVKKLYSNLRRDWGFPEKG